MRFGLQINPYVAGPDGNPWELVARCASALDESAFDSLWVYDHFLYEGGYPGHPYPEPVMESFTTLAAIAAMTRRLRMNIMREPPSHGWWMSAPLCCGRPVRRTCPARRARAATAAR
jgi:hypothetical protein